MPVSLKTPERIEQMLQLLSDGKTLSAACEASGVDRRTWHRWTRTDPELFAASEEMRDLGADAMADEIIRIVDDVPIDGVAVAKARLRAETRMKLLGKWQPKKYGDKVDVRHAGHDGGAVQVAHANVADLAKQMRAVLNGTPALPEPNGSDLL